MPGADQVALPTPQPARKGTVRKPESMEVIEVSKPRDDDGEGLSPEEATYPPGVQLCGVCGEARGVALLGRHDGTLHTLWSPCLCEGLRCKCGEEGDDE